MLYFTHLDSPLGTVTLFSDGAALCALHLAGQKHGFPKMEAERKDDLPLFAAVKKWLEEYFAGQRPLIDAIPLAPQGSEFQKRIWGYLREIPYGETVTYGALAARAAKEMGKKVMSAQAVGGAVGRNPVSIIVPCHRVLGAGGKLTGYDGGLDKKIWLLKHEKTR